MIEKTAIQEEIFHDQPSYFGFVDAKIFTFIEAVERMFSVKPDLAVSLLSLPPTKKHESGYSHKERFCKSEIDRALHDVEHLYLPKLVRMAEEGDEKAQLFAKEVMQCGMPRIDMSVRSFVHAVGEWSGMSYDKTTSLQRSLVFCERWTRAFEDVTP